MIPAGVKFRPAVQTLSPISKIGASSGDPGEEVKTSVLDSRLLQIGKLQKSISSEMTRKDRRSTTGELYASPHGGAITTGYLDEPKSHPSSSIDSNFLFLFVSLLLFLLKVLTSFSS